MLKASGKYSAIILHLTLKDSGYTILYFSNSFPFATHWACTFDEGDRTHKALYIFLKVTMLTFF